jgi:diacylglycerol kinase
MITAELFNSAIELISNFISPGHHKEIEKIKDISAGAVLIAAIAAVAGGIFIFWPHISVLFSSH